MSTPSVTEAVSGDARTALINDLVDANHILYNEGIFDAFGHVSVRCGPGAYLLAGNLAPGVVQAADIMEFDLDSQWQGDPSRRVYLERFIHGEIYRARPDVNAVVHSHSAAVLPFTITRGARLRPVCHMSGFLRDGAPVYDIRDSAGLGTDMLIRSRELGASLATVLGDAAVVLMRGHGCTSVASTLKQAVYRAIYTETNAHIQMESERMAAGNGSEVIYLTPEEAVATALANEGQIERPWRLWKSKAAKALAS